MDPKRKEERRAFNEAVRARMRAIAAERGIPDIEMKWLGRIRHEDLMEFGAGTRGRFNWDWVLQYLRADIGRVLTSCRARGSAMKRRRRSVRKRHRQRLASHARRLRR